MNEESKTKTIIWFIWRCTSEWSSSMNDDYSNWDTKSLSITLIAISSRSLSHNETSQGESKGGRNRHKIAVWDLRWYRASIIISNSRQRKWCRYPFNAQLSLPVLTGQPGRREQTGSLHTLNYPYPFNGDYSFSLLLILLVPWSLVVPHGLPWSCVDCQLVSFQRLSFKRARTAHICFDLSSSR